MIHLDSVGAGILVGNTNIRLRELWAAASTGEVWATRIGKQTEAHYITIHEMRSQFDNGCIGSI
jgi:hypothetical protein